MNTIQPTILVIVGITGDLATRKLLPAIEAIAETGVLPEHFQIVGISRQKLLLEDIVPDTLKYVRSHCVLRTMDLTDPQGYQSLAAYLATIEQAFGTPAQRLFYMSIPPQAVRPVISLLGASSLRTPETKLLLEKPFGTDLVSAQELVDSIRAHFSEAQTYRIDHYLAKEMAQNLIVFRSSNALFKHTWNRDFIESITITASEQIGIEGRAAFYEQTGALRDLVQSHLLQLAALTIMDLPSQESWATIPAQRLAALRSFIPPQDVLGDVTRAQYQGYRTETNNPDTTVETFVRMQLASTMPAWKDVPIIIATGKALDRKATEIHIRYKQQHHADANGLTLRIQPNEGISIQLWVKRPGFARTLQELSLDFSYSNHYEVLPEAYERVFMDALRSDHSLFTTSDEVLASWRILQPVQHAWDMQDDIAFYEPGSNIYSI